MKSEGFDCGEIAAAALDEQHVAPARGVAQLHGGIAATVQNERRIGSQESRRIAAKRQGVRVAGSFVRVPAALQAFLLAAKSANYTAGTPVSPATARERPVSRSDSSPGARRKRWSRQCVRSFSSASRACRRIWNGTTSTRLPCTPSPKTPRGVRSAPRGCSTTGTSVEWRCSLPGGVAAWAPPCWCGSWWPRRTGAGRRAPRRPDAGGRVLRATRVRAQGGEFLDAGIPHVAMQRYVDREAVDGVGALPVAWSKLRSTKVTLPCRSTSSTVEHRVP